MPVPDRKLKMKIAKVLVFIAAILAAVLLTVVTASADEYSDKVYSQLEEAAENSLDSDVTAELEVGAEEIGEKVSVGGVLRAMWQSFTAQLSAPFALAGKLLGVILICSMLTNLSGGSLDGALTTVGALTAVGLMYTEIYRILEAVSQMLSELSTFMLAYIPVYASLLTSGGYASAASGYFVTMMSLCEIVSLFAEKMIVPLCSAVLAVSISEGICPLFSGALSASIKRGIQWALGICATVLVGALSVKTVLASSADSAAIRAAKYTAASVVPVIGGAVSDAYSTVSGSIALIRSAAGAFGVMAVLMTCIRPVAAVLAMRFAVSITHGCAEILGQKNISRLISGVGDVFSIILTVSVLMGLVFIISTALMMLACMNAV